ncbi:hypothetical protein BASA60_005337 [Batrachochytrium salamandrivorans]|nr:hypothetical protein BASA60_005337 [Batrachochytrium salamandrivorans]
MIRLRWLRALNVAQGACSRIQPQQYQHRYVDNFNHHPIQQPSAPTTATPVQQRPTSDDMDIDLHVDTSKQLVLGPTLALGLSDKSKPLKWKATAMKFRETISADSKGTEVVLAPRGETGSFTQMPPTSLLYPHQPAKLNLSNSFNLDPNFSDPSILVSALSSLKKLLLPGTLRLGPLSHVDTFFVDCGADDLFMDSKLAADLQIPLLELSTPITLRLADGDSLLL